MTLSDSAAVRAARRDQARRGRSLRHRRGGLSALVVAAVMALAVAACGSSGSTGSGKTGASGASAAALSPCPVDALTQATGPVEVVLWTVWTAKIKDTLDALVAQYNASQAKVRIRVESQGVSYEEMQRKYQGALANKQLPGLVIGNDSMFKAMVDSGAILPAQSCINADHYDTSDFLPAGKAWFSDNGALYAGAVNLSTPILYYNKDHFSRAGLDPEVPPKTLAEMRTYAEKIKAAGIVQKPIVFLMFSATIESWLAGAGVPLVDNSNGRGTGITTAAAFDTDPARAIYTWVRDMYRDGLLDAIPYTLGASNHMLAMGEQSSSMTIESSLNATSVEAFLAGDQSGVPTNSAAGSAVANFGAGALPGLTEPGKPDLYTSALFITNTSPPEVQAAAWDFLKWWNQPDQEVAFHLGSSVLPWRVSVAQDPRIVSFWANDPAGHALATSYQQALGIDPDNPGPLIGPWDKTRVAIQTSFENMILNGTEPDAAVTDAANQTTTALEQYNAGNF